MQLQQEKHICKYNLLRKCGLLAHTSPTFLKNCCTEKLFSLCNVSCETSLPEKTNLQRPAKGGSTPAFAYQLAAIAPLPYSNLQPYFL